MLWIDAVGGYWLCLGDEITLGRPDPQGTADVPILGDLGDRHARVRRDGEGYVIEALRDVRVNDRPVGRRPPRATAAGSCWANRCGCCFGSPIR